TSDCATILLRVIMGDNYTHTSKIGLTTSVTSTIINSSMLSYSIDRQKWEDLQNELQRAKKTAEEAKLKADNAEKNSASAHYELEKLKMQSTHNSYHSSLIIDNRNGTMSVQKEVQEQIVNTTLGPMPLSKLLIMMQSQIASLEGGLVVTNEFLVCFQEQQNSRDKQTQQNSNHLGYNIGFSQNKKQ
ncbi:MAG: hypothetical protein WC748_04180, partial [Legionellales bacterium]